MSTSNAPLPRPTPIRVTAVSISLTPTKRNNHLITGDLQIGQQSYKLICDQDGTLRQDFASVVELVPQTQMTLRYKVKTPVPWKQTKTHKTDIRRLLESSSENQTRGLTVTYDDIQLVFACEGTECVSSAQSNGSLTPTTQTILEDCPQFRILVIGKTGVGKSTLINIAFGIDKASCADLERGKADINIGLESSVNKRFILHDSLGLEPGDGNNYESIKQFIRSRRTGPLKDQLHAVWFCIRAPQAGERLLETAAEDFFRSREQTMGSIPLIVVFTKLDMLVDQEMLRLMKPISGHPDEQGLKEKAFLEAKSMVEKGHSEITRLTRTPLPFEAVSTKEGYKHTLRELVDLTHRQVGIPNTPEAHVTSVVTLMAQRIDPHLKINGSIDVGKQRYWKALRAGPAFAGHTIWDCLSVIHADIIAVWNFNDPACHLGDKKFRELVVELVQKMQMHSAPNPNRVFALGGGSLIVAVAAIMGAISNPAAPIVLPILVGLAAILWVHDIYQNVKNVQQIFIAFIVDLTHIMETLFILTGRDHNKLTRRAIKLAYKTYLDSDVMSRAHSHIQTYRDLDGRDTALEMIESLIKPEQSGGSDLREYYENVGKLDLQSLNLNQEEDW